MTLLPTIFSGGTANAQSVTVQFLNGRNGKPIPKGVRIWAYFNNETGRHILDLHTDRQGEVQVDTNGAKTFQVSPVGYIPCGEQPVGSPPRDYAIDEILKTGLLRKACGVVGIVQELKQAVPSVRKLLFVSDAYKGAIPSAESRQAAPCLSSGRHRPRAQTRIASPPSGCIASSAAIPLARQRCNAAMGCGLARQRWHRTELRPSWFCPYRLAR